MAQLQVTGIILSHSVSAKSGADTIEMFDVDTKKHLKVTCSGVVLDEKSLDYVPRTILFSNVSEAHYEGRTWLTCDSFHEVKQRASG